MSKFDIRRIANPYDFANPVIETELFLGRDVELSDVLYYLKQAKEAKRPIHVAFLGDRASGKTSFLNITGVEAAKGGFCVVRVDLDEGDTRSQLAFFRKFFHQIVTQAFALGGFGGKVTETYEAYLDLISTYRTSRPAQFLPLTFASIIARALDAQREDIAVPDDILRDDLLIISKEINRPIIVLLDECNVFSSNRVILEKLRNLIMNLPGYMLVFAGTKDLFPVLDEVFSPIMRQFKRIEIGPFSRLDDVELCVKTPLVHAGVPSNEIKTLVPNSLYSELYTLSGGRPYEIQLICHFLFKYCQMGQAKRFVLNVGNLSEIQKAITGGKDLRERPVIQACTRLRKTTLEALSILSLSEEDITFEDYWKLEYVFHAEAKFTRDNLRSEADNLIAAGTLEEKRNGLTFLGNDLDRLYIKYVSRQKGAEIRGSTKPIEDVISWMIKDFAAQFREFILSYSIKTSGLSEVEEVARFFENINSADVPDEIPFLAEVILIESLLRDKNSMGMMLCYGVNCHLCSFNKILLWEDQDRDSSLQKLMSRSELLVSRAREVGWNFTFSTATLHLPTKSESLSFIERFNDERLNDRVAAVLLNEMPEVYLRRQDREQASLLATTAFAVSIEANSRRQQCRLPSYGAR